MAQSPVDEIFSHFHLRGASRFDEPDVTQLGHALQCATHADAAGEAAELVTACLLHDIGHLIDPDAEDALHRDDDAEHEIKGVEYLQSWYGDAVLEPIRLHVDAKRYLTAVDKDYFATLSAASVNSLRLQGGPMSEDEIAAFEANPHYEAAVRLRKWDEAAKEKAAKAKPLEYFRPHLEAALKAS